MGISISSLFTLCSFNFQIYIYAIFDPLYYLMFLLSICLFTLAHLLLCTKTLRLMPLFHNPSPSFHLHHSTSPIILLHSISLFHWIDLIKSIIKGNLSSLSSTRLCYDTVHLRLLQILFLKLISSHCSRYQVFGVVAGELRHFFRLLLNLFNSATTFHFMLYFLHFSLSPSSCLANF